MTAFILRDLDQHLAAKLKREAKKRELSVNRFLIQIIEAALKPQTQKNSKQDCLSPRNESAKLAGKWSKRDEQEFLKATQGSREIDEAMWK
jgi:hypothetical protein